MSWMRKISNWSADMKKQPAIFLDRDGVLNQEKSYITDIEQLHLFDYAKTCIEQLKKCGYLTIVISNQSAVGRNMMGEDALKHINQYMMKQLFLDAIYYCPHWYCENKQESKYNKICRCRKPNVGMIEKALTDFSIDLSHSYLVGDRKTDIETGKNINIKTVLVKSGYKEWKEALILSPDFVFKDLKEFVQYIIDNDSKLERGKK